MEDEIKNRVKHWYHLYVHDDKCAVIDVAKELIEHEDGAEVRDTFKHLYLYTEISWDELREQFDGIATVGKDHSEGGSLSM